MTRTWSAAALAAAVLVVAVAAPAAADDEGGFVIEEYRSEVTVTDAGGLEVVEDIAVDFTEERHGIYRIIPIRYPADADDLPGDTPADRGPEDYWRVIEISDVAVDSSAPADLLVEEDDGALVLRIGDEDQTVTGPHRYRIAYSVAAALDEVGDDAVLAWNVTGVWEDVPIRAVHASVTAPAPISDASCAAGTSGSTEPCGAAQVDGATATFQSGGLDPGEQLTVRTAVSADAVAVPPPIVRERWRLSRALTGDPRAWPLAAVTAVVAFGALLLALRRGRDEAPAPGGAGTLRYDPPEDLRPAEVSVLLEERVSTADLSATLVDLAERGFLEIEQRGAEDPDWRLHRRHDGDPSTLRDYERDLLEALFLRGDPVDLSDLDKEFSDAYAAFRKSVYDESVRRGWFPRSPAVVRAVWLTVALVALVASILVLIAALVLTEVAVAAVPLVLAALAFVALHGVMPHRTAEGARLRAEAKAYREGFLTAQPLAATGPADADPRSLFGRHLPYAVAFGLVPALVHRMRTSGLPVHTWAPLWYGHPGGMAAWNDPDALSSDLGSFAERAGSGLTSSPSSSTGGGGVSAGGGFGGGGGGGW